jgi:hypothetical protein
MGPTAPSCELDGMMHPARGIALEIVEVSQREWN